MGQQVKNLLRAQSKYGLMESSAKKGKKNFYRSQEQFFNKSAIWDRTPPTYTSNAMYMCGEAQGSQIFKRNSIISIHSKVMAFLVILLSPCHPCGPHIVPVVPTSSPSSPHHPHSPQKVPMCSPRLWSPWSPPMLSPSSPSSPHHPRCPHVIPTLSRRYSDHSQSPRYPPHPPPGGGGPQITNNSIRFELIEIF